MKMIRLTRHDPVQGQLDEIKRIWGDDIQVQMNYSVLSTNTRTAVETFDMIMRDADVAEIVLPINLTQAILNYSDFCKRGGTLVKASMEKLDSGKYSFGSYEQLINIQIETREL